MRKPLAASLAAAAILGGIALAQPADAATPRPNVLHAFCSPHRVRDCVAVADDDDGTFIVRDHAGQDILLSGADVLDYLDRHANHCTSEDGYRCVWDAGTSGNGRGASWFVVGGSKPGKGTLLYVGDFE